MRTGRCAMLAGRIRFRWRCVSKVYFIGTAHDQYRQRYFEPGSVVIDPWRMIPDQHGVTVRRLGENRPALISVLVPSRGRIIAFDRMVSSALAMATYPRQIEVIARLDSDDDEDYDLRWPRDWNLRFVKGDRILLSEAWNEAYRASSGEILMHAGDDIEFKTPGWDAMVRNQFAQIPDRIGLVYGDDLSTNFPDLATHGFLHRRWVETVGYFLPPLFSCDWNDVWISEVAEKIGRLFPLPGMVIEHQHHSFGKRERDATDMEREQRGVDDGVVELFKRTLGERMRDAEKLRKVMA